MKKMNFIYNLINNLKNSFEKPSHPVRQPLNFRRAKKLKKDFQIQSLMEIKPFNNNLKEIVAKIKTNYLLSSMKFDKKSNKYSFQYLGRMNGFKWLTEDTGYYPDLSVYDSFYVAKFKAEEFRKGVGTKLVCLAQQESRRYGCEGRVHLDAVNADRPPFYFYRKMGFDSQRKDLLEVVDNYMNKNMEFPQKYRKWCIPMYLPTNKTGIRI